ncbi:hypothetical protein D7287_05450 [Legionella pneumophila]|uniref:hypothetical protein n=1 Tax=Legionella pneumophila TaxID=446 RepID=UPI00048152F0|nr:hypothetical protein [Legionella pneumophila]AOU49876.1 hypothetical protein A9E85_11685 [Legionella pneumophila]RYB32804.1 hypothetical protein D7227_00035 [Legionella pneumophila]RYB35336.1 hypothetical protein D7232_13390 [Legionella pneumophila]RYB54138.1 hypothetical protein D7265_10840 [Legionella pneumophila]RYB64095.1 hypothetical protein D7266_01415 [Legionella pneumophila]
MRYRGIEYKYCIIEEDGQYFVICSFFISTNEFLYFVKKNVPEKVVTKEQAKKIALNFSKNYIESLENLIK